MTHWRVGRSLVQTVPVSDPVVPSYLKETATSAEAAHIQSTHLKMPLCITGLRDPCSQQWDGLRNKLAVEV